MGRCQEQEAYADHEGDPLGQEKEIGVVLDPRLRVRVEADEVEGVSDAVTH